MGAKPGTRLLWHLMPDGSIVVRAKTKSLLDLGGSVKPARKRKVAVEDMNPWR